MDMALLKAGTDSITIMNSALFCHACSGSSMKPKNFIHEFQNGIFRTGKGLGVKR
jgi:hypothetical protein